MSRPTAAAWLALALIGSSGAVPAADWGAELMLRADLQQASARGPLAQAQALQPGLGATVGDGLEVQFESHRTLRLGATLALVGRARLTQVQRAGGTSARDALLAEAHAAFDLGDWQAAAGKKVLGWDVGHGFRPNDVVQQEQRRTLLVQTPEGRPLLQIERYGAEHAWALVLANPQNLQATLAAARGPHEAALAWRGYRRVGALDLHGFARQGRHSGASLGGAAAWVAGDELALHASLRAFRRHEGWAFDGDAELPAAASPWSQALRGGGTQALLGAMWTGASGLSLLLEAWHDGAALSDNEWRDWQQRNQALAALALQGAWRGAAAGNLAWQALPLQAPSLRRDNLFLRSAWQQGDWTFAADLLLTPADRGRIVTASLQFKGERWRFDAALRRLGGPAGALLAQLPQRRSAVLAATLAF